MNEEISQKKESSAAATQVPGHAEGTMSTQKIPLCSLGEDGKLEETVAGEMAQANNNNTSSAELKDTIERLKARLDLV